MDQLDLAVHETTFNGGLTPQQISYKIGIGYQILVNKVSPTNEHNKLTLREAIALMHATGDVGILRVIAQDLGYELRRTDAIEQETNLLDLMLRVSSEHGDVSTAIIDALADGKITPREKSGIRKEVEENITALERLLSFIDGGDV